MQLITLISCAILSIAIAAIVLLKPLILQKPRPYFVSDSDSTEFDESLALLEMISELEVDFQTGKISHSDFDTISLELKRDYLKKQEHARRGH